MKRSIEDMRGGRHWLQNDARKDEIAWTSNKERYEVKTFHN